MFDRRKAEGATRKRSTRLILIRIETFYRVMKIHDVNRSLHSKVKLSKRHRAYLWPMLSDVELYLPDGPETSGISICFFWRRFLRQYSEENTVNSEGSYFYLPGLFVTCL